MTATSTAVDCNGFEVYPSWSSSNPTVASVDSSGNVSCLSPGQADIAAYWGYVNTTSNGGLEQFCGISSCPTTYQSSGATVTVKPTITSISPTKGMAGLGTSVTINGTGFAAGATVTAANITVSGVSVSSSTQMTATFTPSGSANGLQNVTVTVNGQTSNSSTFYSQIPTSVQVRTTITQGAASCPARSQGWARVVTNELVDQTNQIPLGVIAQAGVAMADTITVGTPNDLGIKGTQTGTENTDPNGAWLDTYSVCSSACPRSTGSTHATQTWTANGAGLPHANAIVYMCSSITLDGN